MVKKMTIEILADHNCGYDMAIYKSSVDNEWHISLEDCNCGLDEDDQIIHFCPMCGLKLNERRFL